MKDVRGKKAEVVWDKGKIILFLIAAIAFIGIGFELKSIFLPDNLQAPKNISSNTGVKGLSTQAPNIGQGIQNQINNLKTEAQNVNVVDLASSSPQVQKVINDLKAIQNYPASQLKSTCLKVCNGL